MTQEVMDAPVLALMPEPAQTSAMTTAPAQRPLTVIEHAARSGATPAEMRELMALQVQMDNHQLELMREKRRMDEEDRKRDAVLAFRRDFAAFRGENIVVAKTTRVDRGKAGSFMQAEFHAIANLLSPALSKHGFGFRHDQKYGWRRVMNDGVESDVPWVYVTCFLEHGAGHSEVLELEGPPAETTANTPVQNMQDTASYLKRQGLLAITGTATGGEDDENKMRGKTTRREPDAGQGDAGETDETEVLIDAGRAAALNGMAALNKWWASLTPRQQKDMGQDFGSMRKAARQADEGAQR